MKRVLKKLVLLAVIVTMLASMLCIPASAGTQAQETKRWNIMLVIDSSGSMNNRADGHGQENDPKKLRFEAIKSFLAVLSDDGHNIGAISYADDTENSGMYSLDDNEPAKIKMELAAFLDERDYTGNRTHTYAALREAVDTLQKEGDPNLESVIFLFTDMDDNYQESESDKQATIAAIRDAGIKLCGVLLNRSDLSAEDQLRELVRQANGRPTGDNLRDCFLTITDPASCTDSINLLLEMLGYDVVEPERWQIPSTKTFFVPGVGVEEASIRLESIDGSPLPPMEVTISCEGGAPVVFKDPMTARPDENLAYRESNTIHVYKLKNPQSGTWTVTATTDNGEAVDIYYSPVFSYNIDAVMECRPAAADLHMNMNVQVQAWLSQEGNLLTDPAMYSGYSCFVSIYNLTTGDLVKEISVPMDASGQFLATIKLEAAEGIDYGEYRAAAYFRCGDDMNITTAPQVWDLKNQAPVLTNSSTLVQEIEYGLFKPESFRIDLSGRYQDREDGTNITLYVEGDQVGDGLEILGNTLVVTPKQLADNRCSVNIFAIDQMNLASNQSTPLVVQIEAVDVTIQLLIKILIVLAIVLVIILIISILVMRYIRRLVPDGTCSVTIQPEGGEAVELPLTAPGAGTKRKATLYTLISQAIVNGQNDATSDAYIACKKADMTLEELAEIINTKKVASELRQVKVSVKNTKGSGRKKHEAILVVNYRKRMQELKNSTFSVPIDEITFDFGYSVENDIDDLDDGDYSSNRRRGGKRKTKEVEKKRPSRRTKKTENYDEEEVDF